jgi:hypothetical protein
MLPPTAGESIVKEDNKNKFSTGSVFKAKGYNVKYYMVDFFLIIWKISFQETDMISLIHSHPTKLL